MSSEQSKIEQRMYRAYERGRVHWAALGAAMILAAAAMGLLLTGRAPVFYVVAATLAILAGTYIWRGGDAGNALLPGLAAGLVPLILSAVLLDCRAECSGLCIEHCMLVCAAGSTAAGLLASFMMRNHPRRHKAWVFAVALVPASGLLGCPHVGYGQVAGLVAGLCLARALMGAAAMPWRASSR